MGIPKNIKISGNIYIKYIDDIIKPQLGDIILLLNDDATSPVVGDYYNLKMSGYVKAKIYDGLVWNNIAIKEFCTNREYQFGKKQYAMDTFELCRNIITQYKGTILKRTYRGHFIISNE